MRKGISAVLLPLLLAVVVLTSCRQDGGTGTLRIILDSTNGNTRLISPENYPLDVVKYRISGSGPGGATFNITTTKTSATLEGLAVGVWSLAATGLNENDDGIVQGMTEFTLTANSTSAVIKLDELVGQGNLSVSAVWDADTTKDPEVKFILTPQHGDQGETIPATISSGEASFIKQNLESGSYILQAQLYDSGVLVAGFTEAVRIVADETSSAEISFSLDRFPITPGSLQLLDQSGIPVQCTIEGIGEEVNAGETVSVALTPSRNTGMDCTVSWYVDGILTATGMQAEIEFTPGHHRLDAVAYTDKIGSYGSTFISFDAVISTTPGIPGNRIMFDRTSSGLNVGASTLMHILPDGKLVVFSGQNRSMQLASLVRNDIDVLDSWTSSEYPPLQNMPASAVSGVKDGNNNHALLLGTNNGANTVHFNYNSSTGTIDYIEESGIYRCSLNDYQTFSKIMGPAFYDPVQDRYMMLASDEDGNAYLLNREMRKLEPFKDFTYDGCDYTLRASLLDGLVFTDVVAIDMSTDRRHYIMGSSHGDVVVADEVTDQFGVVWKTDMRKTSLERTKLSGLRVIDAAAGDMAVITGKDYISVYDIGADEELSHTVVTGADFQDMAFNHETGHIYLLDSGASRLLTYQLDQISGRIEQVGATDTTEEYDAMELSPNGTILILYGKNGIQSFDVFRINIR